MARLLPLLAAAALIVVGVGAVIVFFGARDESAIDQPAVQRTSGDPVLGAGNVRIDHRAAGDAAAVERLARELGATDTPATRTAGQALIARHRPSLDVPVRVATSGGELTAATVSDPRVADFVRQHLGRVE